MPTRKSNWQTMIWRQRPWAGRGTGGGEPGAEVEEELERWAVEDMRTSGHQQAIGDAEAPQTLTCWGKRQHGPGPTRSRTRTREEDSTEREVRQS